MLLGVILWGLHIDMTQGLLATMVADTAPPDLRGPAYGYFNLASMLAMVIASVLAGLLWELVLARHSHSTRVPRFAWWRS